MQEESVSVWNECLRMIKGDIAEQSYNTWFEPIKPLKYNNDVLTIQVPSQFFYEYLEEHYVHILKKAISSVLGPNTRLEYSVVVDTGNQQNSPYTINLPNKGSTKPSGFNGDTKTKEYKSPFELRTVDTLMRESQLNPSYTFENYIEGDCNRLARSAGFAVAKKPGVTSFNPLMLYGGVGLGKTHLVKAIGNAIKQNIRDKFVLYVSSEKFTNQFMEAVRNSNIQDFQNFYLQVERADY